MNGLCFACSILIPILLGIGWVAAFRYTYPHYRLRRILAVSLSVFTLIISMLSVIHVNAELIFDSIDNCDFGDCPDSPSYAGDWEELWLRTYLPPPLQRDCFSDNPDVCSQIDGIRLHSLTWNAWFGNVSRSMLLALIPTLITTASAFYATRNRPVP